MNRYVYHYCSQYPNLNGSITYSDGIMLSEEKITSMERYLELKQLINSEHYKILTITSLSLIGREQNTSYTSESI